MATLKWHPWIQSMITTTNWIERLNRDFRRVFWMRSAMPDEESVIVLMAPSEVMGVEQFAQARAFGDHIFAHGVEVQDALAHGAPLLRVDILILPEVGFVLLQGLHILIDRASGLFDDLSDDGQDMPKVLFLLLFDFVDDL